MMENCKTSCAEHPDTSDLRNESSFDDKTVQHDEESCGKQQLLLAELLSLLSLLTFVPAIVSQGKNSESLLDQKPIILFSY